MMTIAKIKAGVAAARQAALTEARKDYTCCLFSRGTFIATADERGQCRPCPEAEAINWNGTLKEIADLVAEVKEKHPNVTSVYIAGGYDAADSPQAYRDGDYDPWAAAWQFDVWTKGA